MEKAKAEFGGDNGKCGRHNIKVNESGKIFKWEWKPILIKVSFKLVEPSGGKIIIDGLDICKLGLHDLRSRFRIIPQDPVLFQGTVRSNIHPIGLYSDKDLWKVDD